MYMKERLWKSNAAQTLKFTIDNEIIRKSMKPP